MGKTYDIYQYGTGIGKHYKTKGNQESGRLNDEYLSENKLAEMN